MQVNLVLLAGLGYSAIGAVVMFLSHRSLHRYASRIAAGYRPDAESLRHRRHDGRYGIIILMCGNMLQVLAACGYSISPHYWRYPSATLIGIMGLYGLWRLLAAGSPRARLQEAPVAKPRSLATVQREFETRRSAVLLDAAIREAANRTAREQAKGPRDRSVVYVRHDWECRWWSDKFGVTQEVLRAAVSRVGPMVADVERYLGLSGRVSYRRAA